ncbi:MAG: ribosome maturation factor RimP [Gammaproteobacteria bacterium]
MHNDSSPLYKLLDSSISGLGYEMLGFEQVQDTGGAVLRIYIDHENGIVIKDCETVSRHISGVLDVEDLVRGQYFLEVSSPGVDRPLFKLEHYEKYRGSMVKIRLTRIFNGRRRIKGELRGVDEQDVIIAVDDSTGQEEEISIPFNMIDKGRLIAKEL